MSQTAELTSIMENNASRFSTSQSFVGGIFFLVALGIVQYSFGVGLIQAYVLPLRRFEHIYSNFASTMFVALLYTAFLASGYFLIAATGGMMGFIVVTCVMMLWAMSLIVVGTIRRWIRYTPPPKAESNLCVETSQAPCAGTPCDPRQPTQSRAILTRRMRAKPDSWTASPTPMNTYQLACIILNTFALFLNLVVIFIIVYAWDITYYQLITEQGVTLLEIAPSSVMKSQQFIYVFPLFATQMQLDVYTSLYTEYCGVTYTQYMPSATERVQAIQPWVNGYAVNMSEALYPDIANYSTVNSWFIRQINLALRPLPSSNRTITSPADSRVVAFQTIAQSLHWFKKYQLNYLALLNSVPVNGSSQYFQNGFIIICRMAPQDYHRFHMPVAGTVVQITPLTGSYWANTPIAVGSGNQVFLNERVLVVIDTGLSEIGFVALVAIGATCSGSVVLETADGIAVVEGMSLAQGDQLGYIQFGGSTVVLLLPESTTALLSNSIVYASTFPVETYVQVRQQIATF